MDVLKKERVAVVVVHGVAPHPRYEFQDEVSERLCEHLNEHGSETGQTWTVDAVNRRGSIPNGTDEPLPTIGRVHHAKDPASDPKLGYFDVIEAYWSPIDKGRTNWFGILQWLLLVVFTPLNTTAKYHASWKKQFFDYGYIGGALVAAFALFFVSLSAVWVSASTILAITGLLHHSSTGGLVDSLNATVNAPGGIPIRIIVWLFVGVGGAFLISKALRGLIVLWLQRRALRNNAGAVWHRAVAIGLLSVLGCFLIAGMASARFPNGNLGWEGIAFLIVIFVAFELGRAILQGFLVDFFGDVQIYTTHDENSGFFDLRERIIDAAVNAARRALSPAKNGGVGYDRVIILAHSLGATIAMDAIMRLYQLNEQGGLPDEDFARLRAFLTLGASLEKTKYFFDLGSRLRTPLFDRWQDDIHGVLFTNDLASLVGPRKRAGIFWANYWYFQDPICNQIASYRSHLRPGEELSDASALRSERSDDGSGDGPIVCRNERGTKRMSLMHPMLHSDYLYDDWVWSSARAADGSLLHLGILDVIAHCDEPSYFRKSTEWLFRKLSRRS